MQQLPCQFFFKALIVINVGEKATVFGFKDDFLEFALVFKGLYVFRVVSIV